MFKPVYVYAAAALLALVATPADAQYRIVWGQTSCTTCPNDWYFSCPGGWSKSHTGGCGFWNAGCGSQCYKYECVPGYAGSWTSCSNCGPGTFSNTYASSSCHQCGAGRYSNQHANTGCAACPWHHRSSKGSGSCSACAAGKYTTGTGASTCYNCQTGRYGVNAGGGCTNCPSGKYNHQTGCVGTSCCRTDSPTNSPTKQPTTKQPTTKQPTTKQPTTKQPTTDPTTAPTTAPTSAPTTQEFQAYQFSKSSLAFHEWQTALVGQTMYKCHDFEGCYKNEPGNRLSWTHTSHPGVALGPEPIRATDDGEFHTSQEGITFKDKVTEIEYYAPFSCECA